MTTGIAVPATATPPAIPGSGVSGDAKKNQDCILRGGC